MKRTSGIGIILTAALTLLGGVSSTRAELRLARVFSDSMVLQRDQPVPVWGWADPGAEVTVAFAGQTRRAKTDDSGRWQVKLGAMSASTQPRELIVREPAQDREVKVADVLVGEVWLCGGQSNMGLHLRDCFNAAQEIAAARYPPFRFMVVPSSPSLLPADDISGGTWRICTPNTAAGFAGTAYFFGRKLHLELGVPIGLIEFDRGATGIEGWVPLEAYRSAKDPTLQETYRQVAAWNPNGKLGREAHEEAFRSIRAWLPTAKQALVAGKSVPPQPLLPARKPYQANPTEIYNGTVHPLAPFAIRGAVWYQGESNPGEGEIYELKMAAMIRGWRERWGQGKFPFYYVQLANEGNPNHDPAEDPTYRYVPVREAQRRVQRVPRTGMVVAIDLGEDASGHPRNKRGVGERLALWALANDYGQKVPFTGPIYRNHRIDGDRVILTFDHVGGGLMVGDKDGLDPVREVKGETLKHFAVAGADGTWYWGEATLSGKTVVVRSAAVPTPIRVRYAYSMNPKGPKLYNREGLPASPFRTDDWQADGL